MPKLIFKIAFTRFLLFLRRTPFVITIDGGGSTGKSSLARFLAYSLGHPYYLESGALYRFAVWIYLKRYRGIPLSSLSKSEWRELLKEMNYLRFALIWSRVNNRVEHAVYFTDMTIANRQEVRIDAALGTPEIEELVSQIANISFGGVKIVRSAVSLWSNSYRFAMNDCVGDGRDAGTAIWPHTDLKFRLTVSPEKAAERRTRERYNERWEEYYPDELQRITARNAGDKVNMIILPDTIEVNTDDYSILDIRELVLGIIIRRLLGLRI